MEVLGFVAYVLPSTEERRARPTQISAVFTSSCTWAILLTSLSRIGSCALLGHVLSALIPAYQLEREPGALRGFLLSGFPLVLDLFPGKAYTARVDRVGTNVNGTVTVRASGTTVSE